MYAISSTTEVLLVENCSCRWCIRKLPELHCPPWRPQSVFPVLKCFCVVVVLRDHLPSSDGIVMAFNDGIAMKNLKKHGK